MNTPFTKTTARVWQASGLAIGLFVPSVLADLALLAAATAGAALAMELGRAISAVLVYLTGVLVVGARSGARRGVLAALLASFIYNFFLSDPRFRLGVTSLDELVPLVAFNVAAFISGGLAGRLQDALKSARQAESRNELLLTISDDLQRAVSVSEVIDIARVSFARNNLPIVSLVVDRDGETQTFNTLLQGRDRACLIDDERDRENVRIELAGSNGAMGAVTFLAPDPGSPKFGMTVLRAAANLLMIALDRCLLLERLSDAMAAERSEKLKDALLSSVSHDLRTPLTAIEAAATSLRAFRHQLSPAQQDRMLDTVAEQCAKLNRYTANLLDMGRIQSGIASEGFMEVDVMEILGVALADVRERFPELRFEKHVKGSDFQVIANEPMLEQVLVNLLENAAIHGGSEGPVEVALGRCGDDVQLCLRDHGPGIDGAAPLFDRFARGPGTAKRQGSGLGLYIARGFTEAFGGTVTLKNTEDTAGALATIRLPAAKTTRGRSAHSPGG